MMKVETINSPLYSTRKFDYFSALIYFYKQSVLGEFISFDDETVFFGESNILYLLCAKVGQHTFEDISGKNYVSANSNWIISGSGGQVFGSSSKPRIVAVGAGNFQFNYSYLLLNGSTSFNDFRLPDGTGLLLEQGQGLNFHCEFRTSTAFTATVINFYSTLVMLFAVKKD